MLKSYVTLPLLLVISLALECAPRSALADSLCVMKSGLVRFRKEDCKKNETPYNLPIPTLSPTPNPTATPAPTQTPLPTPTPELEPKIIGIHTAKHEWLTADPRYLIFSPGTTDSETASKSLDRSQTVMPVSCHAGALHARVDVAPGEDRGIRFVFIKNGARTDLICTIDESATVCSNNEHKITLEPGDRFTVLAEPRLDLPNDSPYSQDAYVSFACFS